MLVTVINCVALQDELIRLGVKAQVLSALPLPKLAETFSARGGRELLKNGTIVICAGGTGNPFCTTDSAAALRAGELQCDVVLKATNVDYAYDKDPRKFKDAKPFKKISYDEVLERRLCVMDLGAISTAREAKMPIVIFNLNRPANMLEILSGKSIGTYIYH
jgi:uridylate kinase